MYKFTVSQQCHRAPDCTDVHGSYHRAAEPRQNNIKGPFCCSCCLRSFADPQMLFLYHFNHKLIKSKQNKGFLSMRLLTVPQTGLRWR